MREVNNWLGKHTVSCLIWALALSLGSFIALVPALHELAFLTGFLVVLLLLTIGGFRYRMENGEYDLEPKRED